MGAGGAGIVIYFERGEVQAQKEFKTVLKNVEPKEAALLQQAAHEKLPAPVHEVEPKGPTASVVESIKAVGGTVIQPSPAAGLLISEGYAWELIDAVEGALMYQPSLKRELSLLTELGK